jgi:ABC-2 type transport system permease protein
MRLYISAAKNEFSKLLSKRKFIVFFILEMAVVAIAALIQSLIVRVSEGNVGYNLINTPLIMLSFFTYGYIPLIIFMAASDLFASEFHDGSIRATLMRPISRFKLFIAKASAVMLMAIIYLAALFLVTVLTDIILGGSISGFWRSFGSYVIDAFPIIVLVLMASLINQLTKSGSLSMLMCIFIYIALIVVGIVVPQMSGMLFTGYSQWHNLFLGQTIPFGALLAKIGLLAGYATVFLCAGYYLFEKRDI